MISIVIPAFNEEKRLGVSLEKLVDFLKNFNQEVEIIVVDDGSTDSTTAVAESYRNKLPNFQVIKLDKNRGKGFAVKTGFESAKGSVVVFTDADFSTPITEIGKLLEKINSGFDIAIGSRALDRSLIRKHQSFLRENIGRAANFLIQSLAVPGIKDTQCGFKAFRRSTSAKLFEQQKIYRYAFDIELLYLARKNGLKIAEVAVEWFNSPDSKVNPAADTFESLSDLIRIRLMHSSRNGSLLEKFFYIVHKKKTFAKFAIVGLTGTFVDYSVYFLLTRYLHLTPLQANPLSVESAIIWNFTFNNLWTFSARNKQRALYKKFFAFQLVSFGGLMLSQMQILLYTHYLLIFDLVAKLLTIPVVAVFNYLVNNRWTFRDETSSRINSMAYLLLIILLFVVYLVLVRELTGSFSLFVTR